MEPTGELPAERAGTRGLLDIAEEEDAQEPVSKLHELLGDDGIRELEDFADAILAGRVRRSGRWVYETLSRQRGLRLHFGTFRAWVVAHGGKIAQALYPRCVSS